MKKFLFILFFAPYCGADPFYSDASNSENVAFAKNSADLTACKPPDNLNWLYFPVRFDELKLVGLVKQNTQFTALLIDKNEQLIDVKINDFFAEEKIQVEQIDMKKVQFIDWRQSTNCTQPKRIQFKL